MATYNPNAPPVIPRGVSPLEILGMNSHYDPDTPRSKKRKNFRTSTPLPATNREQILSEEMRYEDTIKARKHDLKERVNKEKNRDRAKMRKKIVKRTKRASTAVQEARRAAQSEERAASSYGYMGNDNTTNQEGGRRRRRSRRRRLRRRRGYGPIVPDGLMYSLLSRPSQYLGSLAMYGIGGRRRLHSKVTRRRQRRRRRRGGRRRQEQR